MARRFDLILFDLDGTLFDTKASIINSLKYTLDALKLRKLSEEEVRSFLGPPLIASMKRFFPEKTDVEIEHINDVYREYYIAKQLLTAELYPGMLEVLKTLKDEGYKIALATYKQLICVTPLFEHYDIVKYFDVIEGSIPGKNLTKVEIINKAIEKSGVTDLKKVCMIGDTEHDFRGAIQCGINFIGMTYGFGFTGMDDDELKYREFIGYCDHAREILDKVKGAPEK